jgi:hypothetical protein
MKIVTNFDDEYMRKLDISGRSMFFTFFVSDDNVFYPSYRWMDFGGIVLGWWHTSVCRLLSGNKSERFLFMDGPYKLVAKKQSNLSKNTLKIADPENIVCVNTSMYSFAHEIIRASRMVADKYRSLNVAKNELDSIEYGIEEILDRLRKSNC